MLTTGVVVMILNDRVQPDGRGVVVSRGLLCEKADAVDQVATLLSVGCAELADLARLARNAVRGAARCQASGNTGRGAAPWLEPEDLAKMRLPFGQGLAFALTTLLHFPAGAGHVTFKLLPLFAGLSDAVVDADEEKDHGEGRDAYDNQGQGQVWIRVHSRESLMGQALTARRMASQAMSASMVSLLMWLGEMPRAASAMPREWS